MNLLNRSCTGSKSKCINPEINATTQRTKQLLKYILVVVVVVVLRLSANTTVVLLTIKPPKQTLTVSQGKSRDVTWR